MNSYYGILNQRHSQFFDNHSGKAVTASGVDTITTSINLYEKFMANNIYFYTVDEIFLYILNIMQETYKDDDENLEFTDGELVNQLEGTDFLVNYLLDKLTHKPSTDERTTVTEIVSELNLETKLKIYCKNNMLMFIRATNIVDLYYKKILGREDFIDPNEPPEDLVEPLEAICKIVSNWIFYNYQDFHRYENAANRTRKSVLLTDTDSNFVYLYPIVDTLQQIVPDLVDEDDVDSVICAVNTVMYQVMNVSAQALYKLDRTTGIPDSHAHIMMMKNEFLSLKLMLTDNKKQYAQIITLQEGNKYDHPKLDLKGLAIRKVNTNPMVREKFTEILQKDILEPNEVDYSLIIRKYKDLEKAIYQSLMRGELDFTLPIKINSASSYKNPFGQQQYIAAYVWNKLYPNHVLNLPTKANMIKVNIPDWDTIIEHIPEDSDLYDGFKQVWNNQEISNITGIAIGEEAKTIPEKLRPFIDTNSIIVSHMTAGLVMLESIGVKTLNILSRQFPTNIIQI